MDVSSGQIRFELLGPLRGWRGLSEITLGWPKQQAVLAVLLLRAGRVVSRDELVDSVWGEQLHRNVGADLYKYLSRLRHLLEPGLAARAKGSVLTTTAGGYLLSAELVRTDLIAFESSMALARERRALADFGGALAALEPALALWRGAPLGGVPGPFADLERSRLEELRLAAMEQRAEAMLALGRAAELVGDFSRLVGEHPLRERFWSVLMLALYRDGRVSDALARFRQYRAIVVEQLGMEPGPELRRLHERMIAADPDLGEGTGFESAPVRRGAAPKPPAPAPAAKAPIPAQLPRSVPDFLGRAEALREMEAAFSPVVRRSGPAGSAPLIAVDGMAGVGKTALAVLWAHRMAARFPDGQLYVDLHGYRDRDAVLSASAVLGRFLRALGVRPDLVPAGVDEQAALYRSLTAVRRLLIVLDNADSAEQISPLLPGGVGCAVVVTSRRRLTGLVREHGAQRIGLAMLDPAESLELLRALLGRDRVDAEPGTAAQLCALCDHLPLALRIAAASLASRPHSTLADAVGVLAGGDRLGLIATGDERSVVRRAFELSYQAIPGDVRHLFRLLGLLPGPHFDTTAVRALADLPEGDVDAGLDLLIEASLVEQWTVGRYRMHSLVRLFAAECAAQEEQPADRDAAVRRLLIWYLGQVQRIDSPHHLDVLHLPGGEKPAPTPRSGPEGRHEALAWLETERSNLLAVIENCADSGPFDAAWNLANGLRGYFRLRPSGHEQVAAAEAGLRAARAAGNLHAQAVMHLNLADAHVVLGDYAAARTHDTQALESAREIPWTQAEGAALGGLGRTCWTLGDLDGAMRCLTKSLEISRGIGDRSGQGASLASLGRIHHDLGELEQARALYAESVTVSGEAGSDYDVTLGLFYLSRLSDDLGDRAAAVEHCRRALAASRRNGLIAVEVLAVSDLSLWCMDAGETDEAREHLDAALALEPRSGDQRVQAEFLIAVAAALSRIGRLEEATEMLERAAALSRAVGYRRGLIQALLALARADQGRGEPELARSRCRIASGLCADSGYRLFEYDARLLLAELNQAAEQLRC